MDGGRLNLTALGTGCLACFALAAQEAAPSSAVEQAFEMGSEFLLNSDFKVSQSVLRYDRAYAEGDWDLAVLYNAYDLNIQSPDPFFTPEEIDENRLAIQGNFTRFVRPDFSLAFRSGYYDGFSDYRSAWLYEYYGQIGNLPGFGGYPRVEPRGYQFGLGFRWEYLPASGYLEGAIGYFKDWIVPSAEFERTTLLGRRTLYSQIYSIGSENILNSRMRSRLQAQLADTSARELRFLVQGSLNIALGDRWTVRNELGWTDENPTFEAMFGGMTWEYAWTPEWLISLGARYYHDTGEIQDSLPANNAPPGLDSLQVGMGFKYIQDPHTFKLYVAPYFTSYEDTDDDAPFFQDLYKSREWGIIQWAYSFRF